MKTETVPRITTPYDMSFTPPPDAYRLRRSGRIMSPRVADSLGVVTVKRKWKRREEARSTLEAWMKIGYPKGMRGPLVSSAESPEVDRVWVAHLVARASARVAFEDLWALRREKKIADLDRRMKGDGQ